MGGRRGNWAGELLRQKETKMEWAVVVCARNKEKFGVGSYGLGRK
jgi:hypothetical protein